VRLRKDSNMINSVNHKDSNINREKEMNIHYSKQPKGRQQNDRATTCISLKTLNVKGLHSPIRRGSLSNWIKNSPHWQQHALTESKRMENHVLSNRIIKQV
jgi:hypothetical protein